MVKSNRVVTHGFSLMAQGLIISPTLILVKIMPLLIMVAVSIAGWVHLIKYVYLHDDKTRYVCRMPQYTIGDKFQPETYHNQSMVGPWHLDPHHDYLQ